MALITKFQREERSRTSLHPTQVKCKYMVFEKDGHKLLQLNTYGSDDREIKNKLSQTVQLSNSAAKELFEIIGREFGLK